LDSRQRRRIGAALGALAAILALSACTLLQPGPVADFSTSPVVIYAGESFELDGSSSSGSTSIVSYTWELSDGQFLAGKNVNAILPFPGTYTATLTVEDADGRTAKASRSLVVYARTGTVILHEDFSDGEAALARWILDPTWASADDAQIDFIRGTPGNALYIHSSPSRWHRRYHAVELPPLRVGQKVAFSCRIMTLRNQDFHTFVFAPARVGLDSMAGSLPYFRFTSEGGGSYVQVPSALGTDVGHPIEYEPDVYRWHTYTFVFDSTSFEFSVDGKPWMDGSLDAPFSDTSNWILLIGDESSTETCNAYFDDIFVTIEE
jgi:PKD repeat protein